ncbi:hypothetical protein BH10BAC3_BH10BAC3_21930 [soil metagenome]
MNDLFYGISAIEFGKKFQRHDGFYEYLRNKMERWLSV